MWRLTARVAPQQRPLRVGRNQTSLLEGNQQSSDVSLPELRQEQLLKESDGACGFSNCLPEATLSGTWASTDRADEQRVHRI
jgi:hypothetical protein